MKILKEHINKETSIRVEDYPYGFKRTSIRYWIETTKRGDRFVSQTLNPKTKEWNKPKKSIYNAVMVMIEKDNGHISYLGLYPTTSKETINNFLEKTKGFEFSKEQIEQLNRFKALSKVYENVTYECSVKRFRHKETGEIKTQLSIFELNDYEEIGNENGEKDKEQKEIQETINKAVNIGYNKLRGDEE